ncbi:GtrA family protein [Gluconacetobacter entanii]|nr:GtrA family protein [Gluconacetobacter entanii]
MPDRSPAPVFQFLRFGIVGVMGLGWDTATVYALRPLIGLSGAALSAYFVAASANWLCNRLWTFRSHAGRQHALRQWARFMVGNSAGFCLNRGCVLVLFHLSVTCRIHPVFALVAGALSGMAANFHISRRHVFVHDATPSSSTKPSPTADDGHTTP